MSEFFEFAILGLGLAAVYTLIASGVVVIYRGSGVVNFAQGAFVAVGAVIYHELRDNAGWSAGPTLVVCTLAGVALGVLVQALIMSRLRDAAPITRVTATLGLLIIAQAAGSLHYGNDVIPVKPFLSQNPINFLGTTIQEDRVLLFGIGVLITIGLWLWQSRTRVGIATRAAAQNETAATTLGWSPNYLAAMSWGIGAGLAGLAGGLVAPLSGLLVDNLVLLIVPALAAALVGRFDSFSLTLLGATGIGMAQSLIIRYVSTPGAGDALPFLVIAVVMVVTGRSLPLRSHFAERLPALGDGLIRPIPTVIGAGALLFCMNFVFNYNWQAAFAVSLAVAVILLSIVVLTGYAGQISLAQYGIAGLGCYVAARLVATQGTPFWVAALIGIAAAVPMGAVFAVPALRTRGVNLAVVTLGMGVAVMGLLFGNVKYTGGIGGTNIGLIKLFGWQIDAITHQKQWGMFVIVIFTICALMVANIRRSAAGRRLIAIRENERAAASLGVSVAGAKLYAFTVASALAAAGGILVGFASPSVVFTSFNPFQSIYAVAYTVIGGVGFVLGAVLGSVFVSGGIGTLLDGLLHGIDEYLVLIGGVTVVLMVITYPDGIAARQARDMRRIRASLKRRLPRLGLRRSRPVVLPQTAAADPERVPARPLVIDDLTVTFGAVTAVSHASLRVEPGEVVGLIGPNGAGKTTMIDAVTGFVRGNGSITLDGVEQRRRPASKRVRSGIARSWQSLELFEDVSVLENLQVASESATHTWRRNLRALVWPGRSKLTPAAVAAVTEFNLIDDLERQPGDLSYGRRRLVGIARAVALNPSVLLLDEPAAGLGKEASTELGTLIRRLAGTWGMGVLLVEHDVDLVMTVCDRVVVLNFGEVIATGTPDEVKADPAVITAYLGETEDELAEAPVVTEPSLAAPAERER